MGKSRQMSKDSNDKVKSQRKSQIIWKGQSQLMQEGIKMMSKVLQPGTDK